MTPVVGWIDRLPALSLQASEVQDAFLTPMPFLSDARNRKTAMRRFGAEEVATVEWTYNGFRIWGATAMMLSELLTIWGLDGL
ncbi:MAG: hypothetical protein AAGC71_07760 [Pseudomonadota bacterium]